MFRSSRPSTTRTIFRHAHGVHLHRCVRAGRRGLLDGRRATTHWDLSGCLRKWFPHVQLDPKVLFVDDGDVLTAAGAAAGVDMCLHLVRTDHGSAIANQVARHCVVPPWREGGQAQFIDQPVPEPTGQSTSATRQWALERLHEPLASPTSPPTPG